MSRPTEDAKAIVGALVAAFSAAIPVVDDGLTTGEWLTVAVAGLLAFGAVWAVPNSTADDQG